MTKVRGLVVLLAAGAFCAMAGAAAAGGPSPGVVFGGTGVTDPGGQVRYVAVSNGTTSVVQAIAVRTGRVLHSTWLEGRLGIPLVAFDGRTEGLTPDGKTLAVASFIAGPAPSLTSTFALLDTQKLTLVRHITLRGQFSYDAISPDGNMLYLIQYLASRNAARYLVRAYDVTARRLVAGAISDKDEKGAMTGSPVTRTSTSSGSWAYTLYARGDSEAPFVHALDTAHRKAVCIDLPDSWKKTAETLFKVRMSLVGTKLILRQPGVGQLASIDTRTFAVQTYRAPLGR